MTALEFQPTDRKTAENGMSNSAPKGEPVPDPVIRLTGISKIPVSLDPINRR